MLGTVRVVVDQYTLSEWVALHWAPSAAVPVKVRLERPEVRAGIRYFGDLIGERQQGRVAPIIWRTGLAHRTLRHHTECSKPARWHSQAMQVPGNPCTD